MMIKDMQTAENSEMVKQSLIRGKLMSLLCAETAHPAAAFEYFFTGIFSLMDVILNQSIPDLLKGLPLSNNVKQALLGESNDLREMLDYVICFEKNEWDELKKLPLCTAISADRFMNSYVAALKWAKDIGSV
jgi:EAL and modified HD-GYP domain-containing signal transduction protein